jgi:hypothetical protein
VARRKRRLSDVEYTGLTDTAVGFTGSSTLDSSVDPGSPLPLVIPSHRNAGVGYPVNKFTQGTSELWDHPDSMASLMFSGVSDPPFASAALSTPTPNATAVHGSTFNAFQGMSKFGFAPAALLGNHPETLAAAPSTVSGPVAGAVVTPHVPSGHMTLAIVVVVVAFAALLLHGEL